jgi:hypothetical protein
MLCVHRGIVGLSPHTVDAKFMTACVRMWPVPSQTQKPATLQLLAGGLADPQDVLFISFGRWHSNNCGGVDKAYAQALHTVGAFLQARTPHLVCD